MHARAHASRVAKARELAIEPLDGVRVAFGLKVDLRLERAWVQLGEQGQVAVGVGRAENETFGSVELKKEVIKRVHVQVRGCSSAADPQLRVAEARRLRDREPVTLDRERRQIADLGADGPRGGFGIH
eukprot:Amastigsp_a844802_9.p5 type:complete len:128 gc:universal Amastigsp_a844802_9:926-543(-)